ncbi:M24 family metallopeptidase [Rheinheimera sp. WS51]|uniref:M24 family metallopeptidase n=1 Tax=Rheinheimera sp. WS51 TaxID=3425886 RepID=UPI003D8FF3CF
MAVKNSGIGGVTKQQALASLSDMTAGLPAVDEKEYQHRIARACGLMQLHNIDAVLLNAGTNLSYFTGLNWYASERLVCALLLANGDVLYVLPEFEIGSIQPLVKMSGSLHGWQEHENPYQLCVQLIQQNLQQPNHSAVIGIDESAAFFIADGIKIALAGKGDIVNAQPVTAGCRMQKSATEIAIMQRAMDMTLKVHQATASILYPGITTAEVTDFIDQAHRKVGAKQGSYFCIVLFGTDTAFPHGVDKPKVLEENEMVLIDTGCKLNGYLSDITRSYIFGEATEKQRAVWQHEKQAQIIAFNAAKIGVAGQDVDKAARDYLTEQGYGPDYKLPGLPHRTGHGIGMDIHEWPYLVQGNTLALATGMCFSNEPMLVLPGEFGIRLEDHFYITENGPRWFTQPSYAIDAPFADIAE